MTGLTRFEITHYDKFHHISAKLYHHYVKYQVLGRNQVTTTMQGQRKGVGHGGTQKAKIAHLKRFTNLILGSRVNVLNFEIIGFNVFIWIPWSPSDTKKL